MVRLRNNRSFRWALVALIVVTLVAAPAIILHNRSVHKAQHTSGTVPTSKRGASGSKAKSKKTGGQTSASSPSDKTQSSGSPTNTSSGASLITPFGTFVSNHRPGQNGSPTGEQSVCNTSPGATCDIQFTNSSGVVKTLGTQTTDSNGTVYWSWNVDGATLAPGSWHIIAVVKLNGQVKTTPDPTPLEVR